ncbi:hypothetical protein DB346_01805 [Verrucomicrobia bacterium LW23]|nr:hypothetical protein DB346_01805 [Verrucomicrobia bacterium LW23]
MQDVRATASEGDGELARSEARQGVRHRDTFSDRNAPAWQELRICTAMRESLGNGTCPTCPGLEAVYIQYFPSALANFPSLALKIRSVDGKGIYNAQHGKIAKEERQNVDRPPESRVSQNVRTTRRSEYT